MTFFLIIVNFFELLAAVVGTIYLKHTKYRVNLLTRYFVCFLWLTVLVEIIFGWTPWFIVKTESLAYLKNTFLSNNHWSYNIYFIISYVFYVFYFKKNITSKRIIVIFKL